MLLIATIVWSATASADPAGLRWVRNLDDAKGLATAEHKDLLVVFTGLEWCGACIDLDREVLSRPEFAATEKHFVLVDIDLPSNREELGELLHKYKSWMKQFFIHGFPTIMLADATARPYAYFTGYDDETDFTTFIKRLDNARQSRESRDVHLAAAGSVTGGERAKELNAAIACIADRMETLDDREDDDPILVFYQDEITEIRNLDADGVLGLRELYDARVEARDEHRGGRTDLAELDQFNTKEDCPAAIAYIDKALLETTDPLRRYRLEERRYGYLDWDEQYEAALESIHRQQENPSCPQEDRNRLFRNEAIDLSRLKRLDAAIAVYDRQIAAAKSPADKSYFLGWKMNMLLGEGRHEETIATCRTALAVAKPNTKKFADAAGFLAWELNDAGRIAEAIEAYRQENDYWCQYGESYCLTAIAKLQHKSGDDAGALRTLTEAEALIPRSADRPAKQKSIDRMRADLEKARELISDESVIREK
jgi:thioredoxin-related protein